MIPDFGICPTRFCPTGGYVRAASYKEGNLALQSFCERTGEPLATLTTNLGAGFLSGDPSTHCFVKDWSENEGMLDAVMKTGLFRLTGEVIDLGHVQAQEVEWIGKRAPSAQEVLG